MRYRFLPWILEQEGSDFQHITQRWRPTGLLMLAQVRALLKDMQQRYDHLAAAQEELQSLDRADKYIGNMHRMRLWMRQANFQWKADQLRFIQAAAGFYMDYGAILRLLKIDQSRGLFADKPELPVKGV